MKIFYEDIISKPPEIVFPWIAEPEKAIKWQKDVKGGEIIVNKPEVVGTVFREVVEEDGSQLEMNGIITEYIPNKIIGFHLKSRIHEFDVSYILEEFNEKTKFRMDVTIRWKFPMNVISIIMGKRIKTSLVKKLEIEAQELKKLCEGE